MKKLFFGESRFLMENLPTSKEELRTEIGNLEGGISLDDKALSLKTKALQDELSLGGLDGLDAKQYAELYQRYKKQRCSVEPNLIQCPNPDIVANPPAVPEAAKPAEKVSSKEVLPELNLNFDIKGSFKIFPKENDLLKDAQGSIKTTLINKINSDSTLQNQIKDQLKGSSNSANPIVKQLVYGLNTTKGLDIEMFGSVYSMTLFEQLKNKFDQNYPNISDKVDELKSTYPLEFKIKVENGVSEVALNVRDKKFNEEYREEGTSEEDADSALDKKANAMLKDPIMGGVLTMMGTGKDKVKDMLKDGGGWWLTMLAGILGVAGFKGVFETIKSALPDKWKKPLEKIEKMVNKKASKYLSDKAKKVDQKFFGEKLDVKPFTVSDKKGMALATAFDLQNNSKYNWVTVEVPEDSTVRFINPVNGFYIQSGGTPLEEKKVNYLSEGSYTFRLKDIPAGTYFSKGVTIAKGDGVDKSIKYDLPQEEDEDVAKDDGDGAKASEAPKPVENPEPLKAPEAENPSAKV